MTRDKVCEKRYVQTCKWGSCPIRLEFRWWATHPHPREKVRHK